MNYRRVRLAYQIVFFLLFAFLLAVCADGMLESYPVKLFLNMSALSGLGTILSQHNLASGMILGFAIAAATLFVGRIFCGWICPMGACQDAGSFLFADKDRAVRAGKRSFAPAQRVKYAVLIVFAVSAGFGVMLSGFVDPLALITRFAVTVIVPFVNLIAHEAESQTVAFQVVVATAVIFLAAFLLNIYRPRFWCRMVCPLGALLALFSVKPLFRMTRDRDACTDCRRCREVCQGACEIDKTVIPSECIMCMNCIDACPTRAIAFTSTATAPADTGGGLTMSRRVFIASGFVALASVGVLRNFRNVAGRGYELRIRPPGALAERDFLARCIRCGECMKVCPTNVIQPACGQTDSEGLFTPVLNMRYGYCEHDCTLCSHVCPTGAIRPLTVAQKHEEGYGHVGTAFVDRGRCLPWSFGKACLVCQEVCPVSPKAIYFQDEQFTGPDGKTIMFKMPYVVPERCTGCGACEYHCPVQDRPAIRVTSIGEFRSPQRKLIL